jgi:hypothetical protein
MILDFVDTDLGNIYENWLTPIQSDKWYHIAFIKDTSCSCFKAYFNSTLV